jgi:MFS family permease
MRNADFERVPLHTRGRLAVASVAAVVAAASADSSIVALALPQLYGRFDTTVVGVSWVLTAYNAVVAVTAVALLLLGVSLRGLRPYALGVGLFLAASAACAVATNLTFLITARCAQGLGAALVLASSIGVLRAVTGSSRRAITAWTLAAGLGVAAGPALGGVLTEAFDWRAIFLLQVPVAAFGFVACRIVKPPEADDEPATETRGALLADVGIGLLFGALVGALFLSVLLLIPGWGYSPIRGAAIVSVLPLASLAVARLGRSLPDTVATVAGAALLSLGLVALSLLPRLGAVLPLCALALCGAGLGLALPVLSRFALSGADLSRSTLRTIGARHLGLVASLALVAPLLSDGLPAAATRAKLQATKIVLDAPVGLQTKISVALDLGRAFGRARAGDLPNLREPFDAHGARSNAALAQTRDTLVGTVGRTAAAAFRSSFALCAGFAAAACAVALVGRRKRT